MFENRTRILTGPITPIDVFRHPELSPDERQCHLLARRWFHAPRHPKSAFLKVAADDFYRLYINGERVCESPYAGYAFDTPVSRIDLRPYLKHGKNLLALDVFYDGGISDRTVSGDGLLFFVFEVEIDGKVVARSDDRTHCLYTGAPDAAADGEVIDLRRIPARWNQPDFSENGWQKAGSENTDGIRFNEDCVPGGAVRTLLPKQQGNRFTPDREIFGYLTIDTAGTADTRILITLTSHTGSESHLLVICDGTRRSVTTCVPAVFDRVFCDVTGSVSDIRLSCLECVIPSDGEVCTVSGADREAAELFDRALEAVKVCPRGGLPLCDLAEAELERAALCGSTARFKQLLRLWRSTDFSSRLLLSRAPSAILCEDAECSLLFPVFSLIYFRLSGNAVFGRELLQASEKLLTFLATYAREDGMIADVPGQSCSPMRLNALYAGARRAFEALSSALDVRVDIKFPDLAAAFRRAFPSSALTEGRESLYPLLFGLIPEEARAEHMAALRSVLPDLQGAEKFFALWITNEISPESPAASAVVYAFRRLDLLSAITPGKLWTPLRAADTPDLRLTLRAGCRLIRYEKTSAYQNVTLSEV